MYDRASMKRDVKQLISGTRPRPMWIALLYMVIVSVGASLIEGIVGAVSGMSALSTQLSELLLAGNEMQDAFGELILMYANQLASFVGTIIAASIIGSILIVLWQALMNVGFAGYCLDLVKGENPGVGRIFSGFSMFTKVVLTALLVWVFTTLWSLLYAVGLVVIVVIGALLMEAVPAVGVILMVVGYIGFVILLVRLTLRYSMAYYFLLDEGKFGLDAITASKQMMKGKKGKLFMLHLSFIGWYLLIYAITLVGCLIIGIIVGVAVAAGGASLGAIGGAVGGALVVGLLMMVALWFISIWLEPYINGSVAKFYLFFKPQQDEVTDSWPEVGDTTTTILDENNDNQ